MLLPATTGSGVSVFATTKSASVTTSVVTGPAVSLALLPSGGVLSACAVFGLLNLVERSATDKVETHEGSVRRHRVQKRNRAGEIVTRIADRNVVTQLLTGRYRASRRRVRLVL